MHYACEKTLFTVSVEHHCRTESLTFIPIHILCLPLQEDGGTQTQPLHDQTGPLLTPPHKAILWL